MAHTLAAHFASSDLDAAPLAGDAFIFDFLVAATIAFPVLYRPEDALAKQPISFWLEGSIVDRFRLFDFAVRPT